MATPHEGLVKLIEECGELSTVAAKLINYPNGKHPDGKGNLFLRLSDEMADVLASIEFVRSNLIIDEEAIKERKRQKLALYEEWSKEDETKDPRAIEGEKDPWTQCLERQDFQDNLARNRYSPYLTRSPREG